MSDGSKQGGPGHGDRPNRRVGSLIMFVRAAWEIAGSFFRVLSIAVLVMSLFGTMMLDGYGERHCLLGIFLYVPPLLWVLPVCSLLPFALVFCFRTGLLLLAFCVGYLFLFADYRMGGGAQQGEDDLTVTLLSNNVGNNARTTVDEFAALHRPDIFLFQEAQSARYYRKRYPDLERHHEGEFTVVTRFPILEAGALDQPRWGGVPIAARYVIQVAPGRRLVVYNVHFPARRFLITGIDDWASVEAILGSTQGYARQVRAQNRDFFMEQIRMAEDLIERSRQETDPVVLMGDFNVPAQGYVYRQLRNAWTDGFAAVGEGFGYTCPGKTRNPLALFQPWLRIDHAFMSQKVRPLKVEVEPALRVAEHRAIVMTCAIP